MIRMVLGLGVSLALALPSAPAVAKPAKVDWAHVVAATPEGGFRMGNPNAKVKLVEYGSLACPHCRHFEETGYKPLVDNYVRSGRVSYEFRNYLLNAPDISISLLAHCAGPSKFFPMSQVVFATQPQWEDKLSKLSGAEKDELAKLSQPQQFVRLAQLGGFIQIAGRFGLTPAQSRQCLTDPKRLDQLLNITKRGADLGVTGTPTFFLNGKAADAVSWEQLEPLIKAAAG